MKKVDYSETIAACDLKLIDLRKIFEYSRSWSFLDLGPMLLKDEDLTFFSQKPLAHFRPNQNFAGHITKMAVIPICGKTL